MIDTIMEDHRAEKFVLASAVSIVREVSGLQIGHNVANTGSRSGYLRSLYAQVTTSLQYAEHRVALSSTMI